MAYTKADLRNAVARELVLIGLGQSVDADTAAIIDEKIDQGHAWLQSIGVASWDISDIPEEAQQPLVEFISVLAAPPLVARPAVSRETALSHLVAAVGAPAFPGEPVKSEYF